MDIGRNIRNLRMKHDMTQQQLAECLSVSMQTISRWETSVTYPDVVMLLALAGFFRVTVDSLLNRGGNVMKAIESDRLLIRDWNEGDAIDLLDAKQQSSAFISYLRFSTISESRDVIRIWKEYHDMYPIILKATGRLIGMAGLADINRYKEYRELEVHIRDQYFEEGYVVEAHRLILNYGFRDLGMQVACAFCGCDEEIIKHAMIKVGFVYEGTLRKFGRDRSDRMRYSILKSEYLA